MVGDVPGAQQAYCSPVNQPLGAPCEQSSSCQSSYCYNAMCAPAPGSGSSSGGSGGAPDAFSFFSATMPFGTPGVLYISLTSTGFSSSGSGGGSGGIGSTAVAIPASSPAGSLGAAACALLALAFLACLAALVFAGAALQGALAVAGGKLAPMAQRAALPAALHGALQRADAGSRALLASLWAAFTLVLLGLACGVSFLRLLLGEVPPSLGPSIAFPGRDAAAAALVFSLAAAALGTASCASAGGSRRCACGSAGSGLSSAPVLRGNPLHGAGAAEAPVAAAAAAAPPPTPAAAAAPHTQWVEQRDGAELWYLCRATGETVWDIPVGGVLVRA